MKKMLIILLAIGLVVGGMTSTVMADSNAEANVDDVEASITTTDNSVNKVYNRQFVQVSVNGSNSSEPLICVPPLPFRARSISSGPPISILDPPTAAF